MTYRKQGAPRFPLPGEARPTPVLEIGGTHVTAALVVDTATEEQRFGTAGDPGAGRSWAVKAESITRWELDAHAPAEDLLDVLSEAANALGSDHNGVWGIALPGPFDYRTGIALYENVGKFDSLHGADLRAGLAARMLLAKAITFLNDADAFGIGEVAIGAAGCSRRVACITLGTGVGSTFLSDGIPVKSGSDVPPDGSCYLLQYRGRPLEETVSRRAIRRAYADAMGLTIAAPDAARVPDVREIAEASRAGDAVAFRVLEEAFEAVGEAAGPFLQRFGAEVLVVGGSMAGSWDIVEPAMRRGLISAGRELKSLPISRAERSEEAGLIGAAFWAHGAGS